MNEDCDSCSPGSRPKNAAAAPLPAPLRRDVVEFAKRIRREHGALDRDVADRVVRLLRSSVVKRKKPGRKTTPQVLEAVALRIQGKSWPRVYGKVIDDFWKVDMMERFYRSHRLRDAVRAHLKRRRRKDQRKRPPENDA